MPDQWSELLGLANLVARPHFHLLPYLVGCKNVNQFVSKQSFESQ